MKDDPIDWPRIADHVADHARRAATVQWWILQHARSELEGAEALLAELDDQWAQMERLHDRIRHQARRLRQMQTTVGGPLDVAGRENLLRDVRK